MKIELPPDVDKTASGGIFITLDDKFEIPDGYSMNKRFILTNSLRLFKFSL